MVKEIGYFFHLITNSLTDYGNLDVLVQFQSRSVSLPMTFGGNDEICSSIYY